jgi:SagB-type dehydrogenase family enzyme
MTSVGVRENRVVETPTQTLHRLTSFTWSWYEPSREDDDLVWSVPVDDPRVLLDFVPNDLDGLPWFFKRYADSLPRVALPRDLPATTGPAVSVLAGRADIGPTDLDLPHLSRLLHLCAGVVRTTERPFTTWPFRAAGSAGARFPLEVYVAVPDDSALPAGVHWYDPPDHALVRVGPPPHSNAPALVVTGVPWRTGWRYRERGYRHVYWDAGTMISHLLAAADSAGLTALPHTRFPDAAVAELVGADGVHEWPVAVVALGGGAPALGASGAATAGGIDAAPLEFPLVTAAQRAGELRALESPWERGAPVDVLDGEAEPVETVVLARGSQRLMDRTRGLPERVLRTSMGAAMRGVDVPHFVAVHDVDGVAPGIYRWPNLSSPVRAGAMRDELYLVCLEQGLARDAAFVVIGAADIGALDDRRYREAQLAAGLVEGRLHLLAYALGASACGMTFIDGEVPALLGAPLDGLLFTCVGVPEYRSTPGGPPGAPVAIRSIAPRVSDQPVKSQPPSSRPQPPVRRLGSPASLEP